MFECLVVNLENSNDKLAITNIKEFLREKSDCTSIPELNDGNLRQRLWSALFNKITSQNSCLSNSALYLTTIKVLSRDKTGLMTLATEDRLKALLKCAKLNSEQNLNINTTDEFACIVEALKCLCNIILNYNPAAEVLYNCNTAASLIKRISSYKQSMLSHEIKLFDFKLIFLMTALSKESRVKVYDEAEGLKLFTSILEEELNLARNISNKKNGTLATLSREQTNLATEVLKVLFNVMVACKPEDPKLFEDDIKHLTNLLRELLLVESQPQKWSLQSDVINLLTLIPKENLIVLMAPGYKLSETNLEDNKGFIAIQKIIDFLDYMLTETEEARINKENPKDVLPPVLLVLLHLAQSNRFFRKFIRLKVLPNLTQVFSRPEEGATIRNKLCRLLTSPIHAVKDLAEDFLFVLCKENVGRMVKYTGYGNAAGMLARRGLMSCPLEYSSDSENSETEEYSNNKHLINPIVGCRPVSQLEKKIEISDEQKEYLAMELLNKIDKLQREGIIQPCLVGPDGRPKPIEHVQELQRDHSEPIEND